VTGALAGRRLASVGRTPGTGSHQAHASASSGRELRAAHEARQSMRRTDRPACRQNQEQGRGVTNATLRERAASNELVCW
jgi:hypothetical protein